MEIEIRRVFAFGSYRLEVALGRLLRAGQPIPLTPKAFDVLVALIERRDRVVDKAELMKLVWPDSVVEEANLSQTIFVLRKTLGDGPDGQPFIETVPRRGYRFAAAVREESGARADDLQSGVLGRSRRGWRLAAALVLALMILAGIGVWRRWRVSSTSESSADRSRIVVLPFENLTKNRADDWLAGAFSDSLSSGLQNVETLIPVSRDRIVELYRQQGILEASAIDASVLRRMTHTLRVRYFVHGSYQIVGDQIKVSARLVAADSGAIEAQESITANVARLLEVENDLGERFAEKLNAGAGSPLGRPQTTSIQAYQAYSEGRTLYAQSRNTEAIAPLTRATSLDPRYADAWALLAKNQARIGSVSLISSGSVGDVRRDALRYAQRAVELAPSLYDAHVALALAYRELEDVERWRAEALKAIDLRPQIAEAYELLADSYFAANPWGCRRDRNPALAEQYFQTAIRLDPRWAAPYANFSYHLSWTGREDDALRIADQGLAVSHANPVVTRARALSLIRLRRPDESERDVRQLLATGAPMSGQDHLVLGSVALARGNPELAAREFETMSARLPTTTSFLAIARAYLDGGQLKAGLSHLDRAVALEPACAQFAATTPAFAPYRARPEFRTRLTTWQKEAPQ